MHRRTLLFRTVFIFATVSTAQKITVSPRASANSFNDSHSRDTFNGISGSLKTTKTNVATNGAPSENE
ncbi:hypothetical protein QEO94_10560 [Kingella negevensis]|uniref:hypothetical protein n=1 Tax=Kingella negevensis TaxID=1522312 RepID=UPI0025431696|nr:hypothetical protein [Kingella negevensis]WII93050.1 hypothetical protein QEO94_10560 [Kingella negevensis]